MKIRKLTESEHGLSKGSLKYSQSTFDSTYDFLKKVTSNFTKEGRVKLDKGISGTAAEDILSNYYENSGLTGDSENPTYPEEVRFYNPVSNIKNEAKITSTEPVVKFKGKSSHTFTKDKKWEVDFDEEGNILARTRNGKPQYFTGHINDSTNDFPSSDEDNIILAAREQHGLKFSGKSMNEWAPSMGEYPTCDDTSLDPEVKSLLNIARQNKDNEKGFNAYYEAEKIALSKGILKNPEVYDELADVAYSMSKDLDDYCNKRAKTDNKPELISENSVHKRGSKLIKESWKKGDRVQLPSGQTGTVTKDFDWENEDRVAVEIDGMGTMKYVLSTQLRDLQESKEPVAFGAKSKKLNESVPLRNETIDRCLPIMKGTIHKAIREYDNTGILFDLGSNMHVIKNNAEKVLKEIRALKDSQDKTNMQESFNDNWRQRFAGMNVFTNSDYQIKSVILSSGEDGWELGTWNNGKYRRIDVFKDIDKAKKKAYDLKYPLGESFDILNLTDEQMAKIDEIANRYSTSRPVSGKWETETQHELEAIADELNISDKDARKIMVDYLGFSENQLNESKSIKEDIREDAYTAQRYLEYEIPDMCEHIDTLIPNLREVEIRNIISASRKFYTLLEGIAARHSDVVKDALDESLFEDIEVETKEGPVEGPEFGISSLVNEAIQDELKTVDKYNSLALNARSEGFEHIAQVIDEINTEENKHIGQLQEVLKTIAPNAEAIDVGEDEGKEQLESLNTDETVEISDAKLNEDSESLNTAEDVYKHFKKIENVLKDGEAVTTIIDDEYRLNKGNPAYEEAYKKWCDGE